MPKSTQSRKREDFWLEKFTHGLPEDAYGYMSPKVTTGGDLGHARDIAGVTWPGNRIMNKRDSGGMRFFS